MTFEENNKLELVLKHVFLPDDWGHPALWQWAYRDQQWESHLYCDPMVYGNCCVVISVYCPSDIKYLQIS